jgi:cell division septal protein FtsQ
MRVGRNKSSNNTVPNRRREQRSAESLDKPAVADHSNRYAFRRNRTLTGSSSVNVASSNELNAELRSPRAHVHHLTSLRRRLLLYFTAVLICTIGLYVLLSQLVATEYFQVKNVPVLAADKHESYRSTMESYYSSRPVERLRFLLDEARLVSHMQAKHPEIHSLEVEQSGFGEASVKISARQPVARWSIGSANRYVDGNGVVFSHNYYQVPSLQIIDNSGVQVGSNKLVASNRFLGFVGRLLSSASSRNLDVAKVTLPTATTRQVEVTFTGKTTRYKVSVDRSAGRQMEDISRIVVYLSKRNIVPGYVDVRLEGKAFYK